MQAYQTHNGVFGPGGHGGGIFQTTVSGLGSMAFDTKQGIFGPGGHGGGIFQTTVSGLGATDVGPMNTYSEKTLSTQVMANAVLPQLGKARITEDGKLGPKTCQAIRDIVASGKYKTWSVPSACGGSGSISLPTTPTTSIPEYEYSQGMSTGMKLLIAGGAVLVAVGGYMTYRKYK